MNTFQREARFEIDDIQDLIDQQQSFLTNKKENLVKLNNVKEVDNSKDKPAERLKVGPILNRDNVTFGNNEVSKKKEKPKSLFAMRRQIERESQFKKGTRIDSSNLNQDNEESDKTNAAKDEDNQILKRVMERKVDKQQLKDLVNSDVFESNDAGFPEVQREDFAWEEGYAQLSLNNQQEVMDQINMENIKKLQKMSKEEIEKAKNDLFGSLEPEFINKLKQNLNIRDDDKIDNEMSIEISKEEYIKVDKKVRFKEGIVLELSDNECNVQREEFDLEEQKLKWTKGLDDPIESEKQHKVLNLRFDFQGDIINPSLDVPVYKGLHHHGKSPDLAGYTLEEVLIYLSSINKSQKSIAIKIIKHIFLAILHNKEGVSKFKKDIINYLIDKRLTYILILSLKEKNVTVLSNVVELLHIWLVGFGSDGNNNLFYFNGHELFSLSSLFKYDASNIQTNGEDIQQNGIMIERYDTTYALIWYNLLNEIMKIFKTYNSLDPNAHNQLLDILSYLIEYSNEFAILIINMLGFIPLLFNCTIKNIPWPPTNLQYEKDGLKFNKIKLYVKFIRLLCQSHKDVAIFLYKNQLIQPLMRFLVVKIHGNPSMIDLHNQIIKEVFLLAKVLMLYNINWLDTYELYDVFKANVDELKLINLSNANINKLMSYYRFLEVYVNVYLFNLDTANISMIWSYFKELFYLTLNNINNFKHNLLLSAVLDFLYSVFGLLNKFQLFNIKQDAYNQLLKVMDFNDIKFIHIKDWKEAINFSGLSATNTKLHLLFPAMGIMNFNQLLLSLNPLFESLTLLRSYLLFNLSSEIRKVVYDFIIDALKYLDKYNQFWYLFKPLHYILITMLKTEVQVTSQHILLCNYLIQYSKDFKAIKVGFEYSVEIFKRSLILNEKDNILFEDVLDKLHDYTIDDNYQLHQSFIIHPYELDQQWDCNVLWVLKLLHPLWPVKLNSNKVNLNEAEIVILLKLVQLNYQSFVKQYDLMFALNAFQDIFQLLKLIYLPNHLGLSNDINKALSELILTIQPYLQFNKQYYIIDDNILNLRYHMFKETIDTYLSEGFYNLNYLTILLYALNINPLFTIDFRMLIWNQLIPQVPKHVLSKVDIKMNFMFIEKEFKVLSVMGKLLSYDIVNNITLLKEIIMESFKQYYEAKQLKEVDNKEKEFIKFVKKAIDKSK